MDGRCSEMKQVTLTQQSFPTVNLFQRAPQSNLDLKCLTFLHFTVETKYLYTQCTKMHNLFSHGQNCCD